MRSGMFRRFAFLIVFAVAACAANVKLYLKDGSFHLVREYQVLEDRVRFYSVERDEWEEIPLELMDLKKTESEIKRKQEAIQEEHRQLAAEDQAVREQRKEVESIPQEPGVYRKDGEK